MRMTGMKTANATWAPSSLASAVDTIGKRKGIIIFVVQNKLFHCLCLCCCITLSVTELFRNQLVHFTLAKYINVILCNCWKFDMLGIVFIVFFRQLTGENCWHICFESFMLTHDKQEKLTSWQNLPSNLCSSYPTGWAEENTLERTS